MRKEELKELNKKLRKLKKEYKRNIKLINKELRNDVSYLSDNYKNSLIELDSKIEESKRIYKINKREMNFKLYKTTEKSFELDKKNIEINYKDKLESLRHEYNKKIAIFSSTYETSRREILDDIKRINKDYYDSLNEPPRLSTLEEIGNSVSHGIGAILSVVALVLMCLHSDSLLEILASVFYGGSLFLMMGMSCLYHSFKSGLRVKRIFRRFDYSSIYLLIGGTFAPLFLIYWGNTLGIVLFVIQWLLIVTGITMVAVFGPGRLKWLHFPLYFVIGWSGLMFLPNWIPNDISFFLWILAGGLVYSIGMIPFVKRGVPYSHFIWHFFVLLGALTQFIGIFINLFL